MTCWWYLVALVALSVAVVLATGAYLKWHVNRNYPAADEHSEEEHR